MCAIWDFFTIASLELDSYSYSVEMLILWNFEILRSLWFLLGVRKRSVYAIFLFCLTSLFSSGLLCFEQIWVLKWSIEQNASKKLKEWDVKNDLPLEKLLCFHSSFIGYTKRLWWMELKECKSYIKD